MGRRHGPETVMCVLGQSTANLISSAMDQGAAPGPVPRCVPGFTYCSDAVLVPPPPDPQRQPRQDGEAANKTPSSSDLTDVGASCSLKSSFDAKERFWIMQNHRLKSALIRTLERLQQLTNENSLRSRLLERLLELRQRPAQQEAQQPHGSDGAQDIEQTELYKKYEALVKETYRLEQALAAANRRASLYPEEGSEKRLSEYSALVNMQMAAVTDDWREEREEKERALALNAQLYQKVEHLQQQLAERRRVEPCPYDSFETLEPWEPPIVSESEWRRPAQTRCPLPPPAYFRTQRSGGSLPSPRGPPRPPPRGTSRSVDEVLAAPYEAVGYSELLLRAGPAPNGERAEADADSGSWCRPTLGGVASDDYTATNTRHDVTCPHCGVVFTCTEHLLYLNHVEECPRRRQRPQGRTPN
ncbi:uncharacterized protein LOC119098042 [Pollicipes pollicipes]|uniref:uncharacterized protein LOC119098042 n=1 Tax=Pollicipes pollicipes TaxID=41117 RepID=UPI00188521C4|nr:uncharacterized protein LOC119098042 [Pollicipes pollicipes]